MQAPRHQGHLDGCTIPAEVVTPLEVQIDHPLVNALNASSSSARPATHTAQFWPPNGTFNSLTLPSHAPYYYNPLVLPHVFPTTHGGLTMNDANGLNP